MRQLRRFFAAPRFDCFYIRFHAMPDMPLSLLPYATRQMSLPRVLHIVYAPLLLLRCLITSAIDCRCLRFFLRHATPC